MMGVQLTLGMGEQPRPSPQPPFSQVGGALLSTFLQTIPAAPRSPGSCFLQPFTRLSHRAPSRQAQLQGQSAWSICSGTVSSPPARPQHGRTPCCHAAGTAAMEIGEWERSWCRRGQEEGKCPGKGTARGQCDNPRPARCPQSLLPALTLSGAANKQANRQTGVGRAEEYTEPVCGCAQSSTVGSQDPYNHCQSQPCAPGWGFRQTPRGGLERRLGGVWECQRSSASPEPTLHPSGCSPSLCPAGIPARTGPVLPGCLLLDAAPGGTGTLTQLGSAGCREGLRPKRQQ